MSRSRSHNSASCPVALLALTLMTACMTAGATESAAVAASPAATATAEAATLRVDWLIRSYHAPFFLGIAKGWYKQAGIDLTITEGRGSGNVVQLVGNGSDTFGFAGADAVVRGVQRHIPVVSVANIMPQNADAIFVLRKSGITRPAELRGKTIATTPGGTSDALLPAFLKGAGLAVSDVVIVPVGAAMKAQLVMQGKADAMNAPAWSAGIFSSAGGAIGFPYAEHDVHVVGYGIVTRTETASGKPDLVRRFVDVTLRAWEYAVKHPDEALAALAQASAEHAKPNVRAGDVAELSSALALVKPAVAGMRLGIQNEADWEAMQAQLIEYGVINAGRPVGEYLTNRFVR
jgi:NitT/TauT family transport system substrate-binding protein